MSQETIGARLKQAREAKKLTLEQVYAKTKIHVNILQALEDNRFQEQSLIYLKSFLKIYAQFLKLDVESLMQEFKELYQPKTPEFIRRETPQMTKGLNLFKFRLNPRLLKTIVVVITAIVLLFMFVSFIKFVKAKFSRPPKQGQAKEKVIKLLSEERKPKFAKLALRANDNCWVQVKFDGRSIYEGILKKNMAESWQAKEKIEFSVGNAGVIQAEINGQVLSPLGKRGEVIKNIIITRDGFSLGKGR